MSAVTPSGATPDPRLLDNPSPRRFNHTMTESGPVPSSVYDRLDEAFASMRRGEAGPLTWAAAVFVGLFSLWIVLKVLRVVLKIAGWVAAISAAVGAIIYVRELLQGNDDGDDDD
jgi:hypothetical protein